MSIACSVVCLDCLDEAPGIGDGGFLGGPSLDLGLYDFEDWNGIPTFWTLYEPLVGVGLRTSELEEFHKWLQEHRGHRLHLHSDHDGECPPELGRIGKTWDEKIVLLNRQRAREAKVAESEAQGKLVNGTYRLECRNCRAAIESPAPELLVFVDSLTIPSETATMFLDRWGPVLTSHTNDAIWRMLSPATDPEGPFVPLLLDFLEHHGSHSPLASTRRVA